MLMARDLTYALDPVSFATAAGITPDPWQADLLRASPPRVLLNCSRQSGKSTVSALISLHTALYESGSLIVLLAPSNRQSGEMLRQIKLLHRNLDDAPEIVSDSGIRLEFSNDSRILALPGGDADGKTIRGLAGVRLIVADEASRIPDDLVAACRPMMATNPRAVMIALSTPAGRRGWFFESWHNNDPRWHRVRVAASDCPRISQAFLDEELRELGPTRFAEEYELAFIDGLSNAFSTDIIDRIFTKEVLPIWT
jgi:hypothetical protein